MPAVQPAGNNQPPTDIGTPAGRARLRELYRRTLLDDVAPFWLRHGWDSEHGGFLTCLDRDGSVIDTDKSVWFQGRGAWLFATLYNTVEPRPEWLAAARGALAFLRRHGSRPSDGKLWFTVTREGLPLRMRRYVYSEAFAAIAAAAYARATGETEAAEDARRWFETYLQHNFTPGVMPPKCEDTRPSQSLAPRMIAVVTAQELRANLGDITVHHRPCSAWIRESIEAIRRDFVKPDVRAVLETCGPGGEILDHTDGRTLNPGHAIEAAWFILHETTIRPDPGLRQLGLHMLDWMWERGWDPEHGGLLYFTDLRGLPVAEYWHDMKFWWPHCEAILATALAWRLTGEAKYVRMHREVHDWTFRHFPDPEHGEWFGYLRRDGSPASRAKGTLWKGPFHLPRMLWYCDRWLSEDGAWPQSPPSDAPPHPVP